MLTNEEKITSAKALLLSKYPFFGSMLSKTNIIKADDKYTDVPFKTMFTEGLNIYYFDDFIKEHSVKDIAWAFTHELLHIIYKHPSREKNRKHMLWVIACDYAINYILKQEFYYVLEGALFNDQFKNKSAEEIYDILFNFIKEKQGGNMDDEDNMEDTIKREIFSDDDIIKYIKWLKNIWGKPLSKKDEEEIDYKIITSFNYVKSIGKQSYIIDRIVNVSTSPIIDWRDVIMQYIEYENQRLSYRKYNRKYIDDDIYMPTYRNEIFKANIGIDVSGSISDDLLQHFLQEIIQLLQMRYGKLSLRIFQVDTEILFEQTYTNEEDIDTEFYIRHGEGGTNFNSFFKHLDDEKNENIVIFFTDGYATIPEKPPLYPVIWIYVDTPLPWGINIKYEVRQ